MKVGDLVYVAKPTPCCGRKGSIGKVFLITDFAAGLRQCVACGVVRYYDAVLGVGVYGADRERLRVIPPLNELEAEKAVETA